MSLTDFLPAFERAGKIGDFERALLPAQAALDAVRDLETQLDPTRATWALSAWETAYGIPVEPDVDVNFRRARLLGRLRTADTATVAALRRAAMSFSSGDVEIVEHNDESYFDVIFISNVGILPNMDDLILAINQMKPAHLDCVYIARWEICSAIDLHAHLDYWAYSVPLCGTVPHRATVGDTINFPVACDGDAIPQCYVLLAGSQLCGTVPTASTVGESAE